MVPVVFLAQTFTNLHISKQLKANIRDAIGEIQQHTIDNVLKNWPAEAAI